MRLLNTCQKLDDPARRKLESRQQSAIAGRAWGSLSHQDRREKDVLFSVFWKTDGYRRKKC